MATRTIDKPQVNVQLEPGEMDTLEEICRAEGINRPSALVGIWIRRNLKAAKGVAQLMEVVRSAQEAGVDVAAVLTRAARRAR